MQQFCDWNFYIVIEPPGGLMLIRNVFRLCSICILFNAQCICFDFEEPNNIVVCMQNHITWKFLEKKTLEKHFPDK